MLDQFYFSPQESQLIRYVYKFIFFN